MTQASRPLLTALAAALVATLAACSTTATEPAPASTTTSQAAADANATEKGMFTGSRLPRKSSDHNIRQTGAAGAKEMERDRAPNPGPTFN